MVREVTARRLDQSVRNDQRSEKTSPDEVSITSLRLHAVCVVLALLAAAIFTLTEHEDDHEHTLWCVFEITMQFTLVIIGTAYFRLRNSVMHNSSAIAPMLVMIACLSLICEPIQRILFGTGHAFEMLVMHCQCNLMLALAVCGFRMSNQRLSVMIAVFMTIFCGTISTAPGLIPLLAAFAVVAIVWMVLAWWETVEKRQLNSDRTRIPRFWLACAASLPVVALMTVGSFGSNSVTTALRGFMPSSGGTGEYSPFSRGGVNDGDALVAGDKDIKSFAPLDDAPFVESDQPSLYDVFNDTYDDPVTKIKQQDRAIALPPEVLTHIHQLMAESKQAGKEFSLLRSEKKASNDRIRDLKTKVLFYVAGRTPMHFKTEVYELFNGIIWTPGPRDLIANLKMKETSERDWLSIKGNNTFEVFSDSDTHSIKVANLDGNVIPAPTHAIGVNIDKVDRVDMYSAWENGILAMNRESVPPMTPINFVSRCMDPDLLRNEDSISFIKRDRVRTMSDVGIMVPDGDDTIRIRLLAQRITADLPRGWRQVEAITQYLQQNYVLDRTMHAGPDSQTPVADFLFEMKRGPEYLFASSAAMMLRTLGYPTRLVGGFYARPEHYDARKQHTHVHGSDAHFWCEVSLGARTWFTVEASPGYSTLLPRPGFFARVWLLVLGICQAALRNAVVLISVGFILAVLYALRRRIQDALLTLKWRLTSKNSPRQRAVRLASLVDHRLRLAGVERKPGVTLKRWSHQTELEPVRDKLLRIADIADHAMFGIASSIAVSDDELRQLEQRLRYHELKQLIRPVMNKTNAREFSDSQAV